MEGVFKAAVGVFVAAAAMFFYYGNIDGVFISIVLACLSFFLIIRFQVKGRLAIREREREAERIAEEYDEDRFIHDSLEEDRQPKRESV